MSPSPLRQFISCLESAGELTRISVPASPRLEIAAITDRVCKQPHGGTGLLFENPAGADFPVATNLFGSRERVLQALDITDFGELTDRLQTLLALIPELDLLSLDRQIAALPEFKRFAPHATLEPDPALIPMIPPHLERFPFLHSWPDDGSAEGHSCYITLPQIFTADPDGGSRNCGLYRVQLRGEHHVAIQWKAGSGAARHAEQFHRQGKAMPVAIVLGGDPATLFSAMSPLPGDLDELTFAGFLRGAPLTTVACQRVPLQVPTGAEVVIEGYVEAGQSVIEGPFGNHSGFYSPASPAALMRVTAISHRPDAIIPATIVGPPPMEDCWMAQVWERLLLAFLRRLIPAVSDIHFPNEWIFHQSAIICLENPQPDMVRNSANQLWQLPWFASSRILLFVTAGADITTLAQAAWKSINVTDLTEDIFMDETRNRIAIDATGCRRPQPEVNHSAEYTDLVSRRWKEYGLA